jgi:hypothetical protein
MLRLLSPVADISRRTPVGGNGPLQKFRPCRKDGQLCNLIEHQWEGAMTMIERRSFLKKATIVTTGGMVANPLVLFTGRSFAQGVPGNSQYGVKALLFDMFGTVLDWRTGVARSVEVILKPRGYALDWFAFADGWRAMYQPGMEDVRAGRIPYTRLDTAPG